MAGEEEPWKVMDLEEEEVHQNPAESAQPPKAGPPQPPPTAPPQSQPAAPSQPASGETLQPAKPRSVFDRLAYGNTNPGQRPTRNSTTVRSSSGTDDGNSISASEPGPNSRSKKAGPGRPAAKAAPAPKTGGGTTVFDRLSSGNRLYRSDKKISGPSTVAQPKPNSRKPRSTDPVQPAAEPASPTATSSLPVDSNGGPPSSSLPDQDQLLLEEEEIDPVINISLIQPIGATAPRPVRNGKSAAGRRLLSSHKKQQRLRRKSWRIHRLPAFLVERTSLARGALPVLPPFLAWICLLLNSLVPGTGTILSGLLGMCLGAPRFSPQVTAEHRFLALVINLVVGISQVVTVLFCLVGWCWSLGWGIILVKTAGFYKRWRKRNAGNPEEEHHHTMIANMNSIKEEEMRY